MVNNAFQRLKGNQEEATRKTITRRYYQQHRRGTGTSRKKLYTQQTRDVEPMLV